MGNFGYEDIRGPGKAIYRLVFFQRKDAEKQSRKGFMKYLLIAFSLSLSVACSNQNAQVSSTNSNAGNSAPMRAEKLQDTAVHTTENLPQNTAPANSNTGAKWSQGGDPIDTSKFDKAIADADKALKAKPADEAAKTAAAQAYFERGFALTEARQYASAIGDYRRALKIDPNHEESLKWVDQIVGIYKMLKKEAPKPGEEPPPLPFKKATS
jgi:tetratricopeptide (TPR) repeat protein